MTRKTGEKCRKNYTVTKYRTTTVRPVILCASTTKKSDNNQPKKSSTPKGDASTHRRIS